MAQVQETRVRERRYAAPPLILSVTLVACAASIGLVNASNKVVGGVPASPGEFPWIVTFVSKKEFCAATLISPSWLVTAAHCALNDPSEYTVKAGVHGLQSPSRNEVTRYVSSIHVYPYYQSRNGRNDIALVKLSSPFELNPANGISNLDIAPKDFIAKGETQLAGWGVEDQNSKQQPAVLLKVTLPVVPNDRCRNFYAAFHSLLHVGESVICAGGNQKSACFGDSGGPLMCSTPEDKTDLVLCGVVSAGLHCGEVGLFTRISYYRDWIKEITGL